MAWVPRMLDELGLECFRRREGAFQCGFRARTRSWTKFAVPEQTGRTSDFRQLFQNLSMAMAAGGPTGHSLEAPLGKPG